MSTEIKKSTVLSSPGGVDDLWSMMGMKKFSVLDVSDKEAEKPDLGKPYVGQQVLVDLTTQAATGQSVVLKLSVRSS